MSAYIPGMYVKRTFWDPMEGVCAGSFPRVYADSETNTLYKHSPIVIGIMFI